MNEPKTTPVAISEMCDVKSTFAPGRSEVDELNQAHFELVELTADFVGDFFPKATALGRKLLRVKAALGHGNFGPWAKQNLRYDERTARRYMARAKVAERTALSDLRSCARLMAPPEHSAPKVLVKKKSALKLFSTAGSKVLQQPVESISPEDKATISSNSERLEPIALQLRDHPSIFSLTWQKKLSEAPVRWSRREVALFRQEVAKAKKILRAVEADAEFDVAVPSVQTELAITMEGKAA